MRGTKKCTYDSLLLRKTEKKNRKERISNSIFDLYPESAYYYEKKKKGKKEEENEKKGYEKIIGKIYQSIHGE